MTNGKCGKFDKKVLDMHLNAGMQNGKNVGENSIFGKKRNFFGNLARLLLNIGQDAGNSLRHIMPGTEAPAGI